MSLRHKNNAAGVKVPATLYLIGSWYLLGSRAMLLLFASLMSLMFVVPSSWAQGVNIPASSTVNVNTGTLNVAGNVSISTTGTLQTTTGTVKASGNWTNSGTFTPNTGTVEFTGSSGIQDLNSGGTGAGKLFFNLTHSGAGTLRLITNNVDIDGNLSNTAGTLNANGRNMNVAANWNNSTGATFTHGNGTVTLDGAGGVTQTITGASTFYILSKVTPNGAIIFENTKEQIVVNTLTLQGGIGQLLSLNSDDDDASPTQSFLTLQAGGLQNLSFLTVKNNNANNGLLLVGGTTSTNGGNNINWSFGGTTLTWQGDDGTTPTDWNTASNWDLGFVPTSADTVIIPGVPVNQPTLATNVTVANLTINSSAVVTLAGNNLTVSTTFNNSGTVRARGNETVTLTQDLTNPGLFLYVGDNDGVQDTYTGTLLTTYYNVQFNDTNGADIFRSNANIAVTGTTNITAGTLDISTNTNTLTTTGALTLDGGILTATNGNIDANGNVSITAAASTLTAPVAANTFTIAGNFAHSNGTFTHSSGTVTLDGTSQTISGDTTFYGLSKITANGTLTFTAGSTQTIATGGSLILQGTLGNLMAINSSVAGTKANLTLTPGATQSVKYVTVRDNDASVGGGRAIVARNSTEIPAGSTINWLFGPATMTWDGSTDIDWDKADNWDLGIVPNSDDTAIIPNVATQPTLSTDVNVENLNLNHANSIVTLNGKNLTVDTTFTNSGTIRAQGGETITLTQDLVNTGTFLYVGDNDAAQDTYIGKLLATYYNLQFNDANGADIFRSSADIAVTGTTTVTAGTFDISSNTNNLTANGALTVDGGTLTATNSNIDANSHVAITAAASAFSAPTTGKTFTVAGNFTHSNGTFTSNTGTVTFDTTATAVISGNTTFNNFTSIIPGKTLQFAAGSTQTINGTLSLQGNSTTKIILASTVGGNPFTLNAASAVQSVLYVDVSDSDAAGNDIVCVRCNNGGGNDDAAASPHWIFLNVAIDVPATGPQTIDTLPTIIGTADAGSTVDIKDSANNIVATTTADANGNWRVEATVALATGANSLTPYIGVAFGPTVSVNVSNAPSTDDVPTITSPLPNERVNGNTPTIVGQGLANASVTIVAADAGGSLLLSTVGSGTVDASGNYSITLTTALPKGINYLSVTIDGVASDILTVSLTDPFGIVFDSASNNPIQNATVTLYRAATNVPAVPGVDLDAADVNPVITPASGLYSFLAANGNYYLTVSASGYDYPSVLTTFPAGRTITTGSKGEIITVAGVVLEIDQPMDSKPQILRITKDANKSEVRIGEVVTYTVTIENTTQTSVTNFVIQDRIPPGFKYLDNRVTLDGTPIVNPSGNRPLDFSISSIGAGQTRTLKYQLVVGSGVTVGKYENVAVAKYSTGQTISNTAIETVKVVLDPLFDLGTVMGKVFFDYNENGRQDAPEYSETEHEMLTEGPVSFVKIVMEDGTVIETDKNGQFSVPSIVPGRHLFRVDERTLPEGSYLTTEKVVILDVTQGGIFKVNFGVSNNNTLTDDQTFFTQKLNVSQDQSKPVPRMNVALWDKEIGIYNDLFVDKAEFYIFNNYASFIKEWKLEILDTETKKVVKSFAGDRSNIHVPIIWDGKNDKGDRVRLDRSYEYIATVYDAKGRYDETKEKPITFHFLKTESELDAFIDGRKVSRGDLVKWLIDMGKSNGLEFQNIPVDGETLKFNGLTSSVHSIRIMREGLLVLDMPVIQQPALTAQDLLNKTNNRPESQTYADLILPKGQYQVMVQDENASGAPSPATTSTSYASATTAQGAPPVREGRYKTYVKDVNVGEDYLFFVAMGDAKAGYTFNTGNIEPVQQDDKYKKGFWSEGKAAYYLKGKILGKYLITSSFDSERQNKELFKSIDPDEYYPIYGDYSSRDYQAADTQGNLYLLLEWDRSQAIWGNYPVDFTDTEFAQFNRTLYGGKIDYKSVGTTQYGAPRTKVVVFRAKAQQRAAHVEMLATGGSLYYLKHKDVIDGSDRVKVEIRDKITGLVVTSRDMKAGADYEIDYEQGRMLFWKPIPVIVDSYGIISSTLLEGNLVYVIADYEYESKDKIDESNVGARVQQAVTDNVVVGGTYVEEEQETQNYKLAGTDVALKLGSKVDVKAEYATSSSEATGTFVSTDGGLTFTELPTNDNAEGEAYGISGDWRLFNRLALHGYYKWIDNDFSSSATAAQQGKELSGMSLSYELGENTSFTASQDIQKLINSGNAQTEAQVGAQQTTTTMMQLVHQFRKLKITGEYRRQEVKEKLEEFSTETNTEQDIAAVRADYQITDKTEIYLEQQMTLKGENADQTTIGVKTSPKDGLLVEVAETISPSGTATKLASRLNLSEKLSLSAEDTSTTDTSGNLNHVRSVGLTSRVDDQTAVTGSLGTTESTGGERIQTLSFGGTSQVDEKTSTESKIAVSESSVDGKSTQFSFGTHKKLRDDLEVATTRTFGTSTIGEQSNTDTYSLIREKDGRRLEGSLSRQYEQSLESVSRSNIFGLSGDIDDRWAFTGSLERGTIQNLDGTNTDRTALSTGLGYVKKDEETGEQVLKSSSKLEVRFDSGDEERRQYVLYNATEGRVTEEFSLFNKMEFSRTLNTSTDDVEAEYKEMMVGGAYRPIMFDRLNLLGRYSYIQNKSPEGQTDISEVEDERAHVFAFEGVYDINERWQLSEKYAYRIMEEKVAGFDFNKTHTWLMVHRLNYNIDTDWLVGAEFRILSVEEAKDSKRGFLIEAARRMGQYAQLGFGYNFTDFNDDLTALNYTAQGPFVRLTGKFYDQTPQEIERSKAKWIEEKMARWAWLTVQDELSRKDSPIIKELNIYYRMARVAHEQGRFEEAHQVYKDIIVAGEMMFEEAYGYINSKVQQEKDWQNQIKLSDQYYRNGELEKAKKILEKVLEELEERMLEWPRFTNNN